MSIPVVWIVFAAVSLVAAQIAKRDPEGARKASRLLPLVIAFLLGALAASGWLHAERTVASIHRWTADTTVLAMWISVAFASGTLMAREIRQRPVVAIVQLFAFLLVFGLLSTNALTGYFGVINSNPADEETVHRLRILHLYALPACTVAMLAEWWWFFAPPRESVKTPT
jgi:hypothetical protein